MDIQGQRLADSHEAGRLDPGQYRKTPSGWFGATPNGLTTALLGAVEQPDGTISVPSIRATNGLSSWIGSLEAGFWKGA
jgi:hypothetical protein